MCVYVCILYTSPQKDRNVKSYWNIDEILSDWGLQRFWQAN